jgi:Flp pilus assembly protein TadD
VLGYHLANILLHTSAALMVASILRRLKIPGAYLAAAVFALHPINVESVAWITEQKNTLSAIFYLGAAMAYLSFDEKRGLPWYCLALGLFALGLLSKTVTATLPAALLVIFWWQRGRLSWRADVLPLVPFFTLGAAGGVATAVVERKLIGAEGMAFDWTIIERGLIGGRAIWFYLYKLFWPAELIFIYPRWQVSQSAWWQYLFPAAALLLVVTLWLLRRRWRAPLAGVLFFVGTLFPVLGICNVYPFIFSYVADHFQYLASLGVITLASAGAALLLKRWRLWRRPGGYAVCLGLLGVLAGLTWRQSALYVNVETLYRATIARNPACWMAQNNLGLLLTNRGDLDEAFARYHAALRIRPDYAEAHSNLAIVLARRGKDKEAEAQCRIALKILPDYPQAHSNLGVILAQKMRFDEAIAHYQEALKLRPDFAEAHGNLASALGNVGNLDDGIAHFQTALQLKPDYDEARNNMGILINERNRILKLLAQRRELLRSHSDNVALLNDTAWRLATNPNASFRNGGEAVALAERAVQLTGAEQPAILGTLAAAYAEANRFSEAVKAAQAAVELATKQNKQELARSLESKIRLYESKTPFRAR